MQVAVYSGWSKCNGEGIWAKLAGPESVNPERTGVVMNRRSRGIGIEKVLPRAALYIDSSLNCDQVEVDDSPSGLGSSRRSVSRGVAHRRSSRTRTVDRDVRASLARRGRGPVQRRQRADLAQPVASGSAARRPKRDTKALPQGPRLR